MLDAIFGSIAPVVEIPTTAESLDLWLVLGARGTPQSPGIYNLFSQTGIDSFTTCLHGNISMKLALTRLCVCLCVCVGCVHQCVYMCVCAEKDCHLVAM